MTYTYLRTGNGAAKLDGTPATFGPYTFTLTKRR